jgi:hypothetical protein
MKLDNVDEVADSRLRALREIEREKLQMARAYNKRVREKSLQIGDLVWKMILPLGTQTASSANGLQDERAHIR